MYCLTNICYVCLKKKDKSLININNSLLVNKDIIHIIGCLPFNLAWLKTKEIILICEECCLRLREFYKFLAMCLENSALLQSYMDKLNTRSISIVDNEAELRVQLNKKQDEINEMKCEIKLEDEEIYTFERGAIIEENEDVFVNVAESFVKEEDTWKMEEVEDKEESPMGNNFTENSDKQVPATNKKELNAAAKKAYTCLTCSKSFIRKGNLKTHTRVHTGEKPFKCRECGKCFSQQSNLAIHLRIHAGEKPFKCSRCAKCFCLRSSLTIHMRVHTGEKPFKCSRCEKCFRSLSNLVSHLRVHTGEKPFKCSRCEKCFSIKSNLAIHMRVHTGEKPFKCTECDKCFSQQPSLAVHMRVHTGEKPFKCYRCEKCFSSQSNLATHMRVHTGKKRFKCSECGKCFSHQSSLVSHMRRHTGT